MECHYHPEREGTDICAICGKPICKECGLEIAGKVYCKDCLEKIVGLGLDNTSPQAEAQPEVEPEPVQVEKQPVEESVYQPQEEYEIPYAPAEETNQEYKIISDDSPYNIKDNIEYSGGLESSYLSEDESLYQQPPQQEPQNEYEYYPQEEAVQQPVSQEPEYIYPDHSYEPQPTSARQDLEDKYEKYLDDLYFDEKEVPLGEQLAKDEEQYGSLTKKEYAPRPVVEEVPEKQAPIKKTVKAPKNETPEEMEARIRAEIAREMGGKGEDKNIHNLNYQEEKEPMGVVDILLTIILIIVILVVLYYIVYLFFLHSSYSTFMDAIFALKNPQNVVNTVLTSK
ncbi:ATPase [uncultured Methanobrevibacter sp.]|uniref:ATPase n=1 Tax=uncultured Methanobrevibacter sp. TaxID=253161 RepID=UPI002608EA7A|nr:ATPase [uncultured Methanobrevibacter sp.]